MHFSNLSNTILMILIFGYFIHDQYEYGTVRRFRYLLLPIFTIYQYVTQMRWTGINILISIGITIVAAAISYYQASGTQLRTERIAVSYFEWQGAEVPIYRRRITARGGSRYLIGWGLIILVQFVLELFIVHEHFSTRHILEELTIEVLNDLNGAFRFAGAGHGNWSVWALTSFTSIFYLYGLVKRSPMFGLALRNNQSLVGVEEETRK